MAVVHDLHLVRAVRPPPEEHTPLRVDPDAALAFAVRGQRGPARSADVDVPVRQSGVNEHAVEVVRVDSVQPVAPREPALVENTVDVGHFGSDSQDENDVVASDTIQTTVLRR